MVEKSVIFEFDTASPFAGLHKAFGTALKEQQTLECFCLSFEQWYTLVQHADFQRYGAIEADNGRRNIGWLGRVFNIPVRKVIDSDLWPSNKGMALFEPYDPRGRFIFPKEGT